MSDGGRGARRGGKPAIRLTLPVSGVALALGEPTGREDMLLAEARDEDPSVVLALIGRLARAEGEVDWAALPVFDIDTLIMRLRQRLLGETLSSHLACASEGCASRVTLSFGVETYLGHHAPHLGDLRRRGWSVGAADEAGWRPLIDDAGVCARLSARLRLPTLRDQIAVAGLADPAAALARRCLAGEVIGARVLARAAVAMAALAPPLSGPLHGVCPDCGAPITAWFEARAYCLRELSFRARFVYEDVDVLAERYHWSERAILTLPAARRAQYAELARQARAA